jgi:enamine deaminase RidA (YjgF/YER057c/UK114 family)
MDFEQRARAAGVDLDMALPRVGSYELAVPVGDLLFVAGSIAWSGEAAAFPGHLGDDLDVAAGQMSARGAAATILASVHQHLGSLNRVRRLVRLTGYVSSAPSFGEQPAVMNGASDLMIEIFGDAGRHARSAIGLAALPLGASVEIDSVFQIQS